MVAGGGGEASFAPPTKQTFIKFCCDTLGSYMYISVGLFRSLSNLAILLN